MNDSMNDSEVCAAPHQPSSYTSKTNILLYWGPFMSATSIKLLCVWKQQLVINSSITHYQGQGLQPCGYSPLIGDIRLWSIRRNWSSLNQWGQLDTCDLLLPGRCSLARHPFGTLKSLLWQSTGSDVTLTAVHLSSFFFWQLFWMQQVSNITSNQNRLFGMWHLVTGRYKFHPRHLWNKSSAVRLKKDLWPRGWLVCWMYFPLFGLIKQHVKSSSAVKALIETKRKLKKIICVDLTLKAQLAAISVLPRQWTFPA